MNTNDFWNNLEEKVVELMKKETPFKDAQIRVGFEQMKKTTALGYALKSARQNKRISVKKMSAMLKISEADIKKIESGEVRDYPLGLITAFLNALNCILSFQVLDLPKRKKGKDGT